MAATSALSFPMEGYTLAIDLKKTKKALSLCDRLDELIIAYKGRTYLAKDARMAADSFNKMYPISIKSKKFQSVQAQRIMR